MLEGARFHHIAIIASDVEASLVFYRDLLGFSVLADEYREERKSRKVDLGLASGDRIELFSFPGSPRCPTRPEAVGLRHLAFEVDELDAVVGRATDRGIDCEPIRLDGATGRRFTFFADPDGLPLELYQGPPRSPSVGLELVGFVAVPAPPLAGAESPAWAALATLPNLVSQAVATIGPGYVVRGGTAVHESAFVHELAELVPPIVIGPGCRVARGALARDGVMLVRDVVVGPGSEVARTIVHEGSALAHFNFVGDSIIGANVNLEAGAIIANHFNERSDTRISVSVGGREVPTGLTKFGAVVGDGARIGANAVVGPGALVPPRQVVPRLGRSPPPG